MNPNWKTTKDEAAFDGSPWLRVQRRVVITPDGARLDDWYFADFPSFVNVLVRTQDELFLIVEVEKYACDRSSYSLVGGFIEAGESPIEAARRELLEEAGFVSPKWIELGSSVVDPNRGCGSAHFFMADEAIRAQQPTARIVSRSEKFFLINPGSNRRFWKGVLERSRGRLVPCKVFCG